MSLERYFKWYEMSQKLRVRLTAMKLVGQARQYWSNVERLIALRRQEPIRIWDEMKAKLSQKYLPITFQDQQLDKWSRFTQGTRSADEYIEKFVEFLTQFSEFVDESPMVTLSRFMSGLRDDLRRELFTRGVSDLEHAYQIVQDLDASRGSYYQRGSDYRSQGARATSE